MTPQENSANQQNANIGTKGTNTQYDKAQGNRGKQLNPNQAGRNANAGNRNTGGKKGK